MPTTVIPLSVRLAAFHESQRDWHLEMAREHVRSGHARAEQDHLEAAEAHAAAMEAPLDDRIAGAGLRASGGSDRGRGERGEAPTLPGANPAFPMM